MVHFCHWFINLLYQDDYRLRLCDADEGLAEHSCVLLGHGGLGLADSSGFRFLVDANDIGNLGWSSLLLGWCLADAVR